MSACPPGRPGECPAYRCGGPRVPANRPARGVGASNAGADELTWARMSVEGITAQIQPDRNPGPAHVTSSDAPGISANGLHYW
jgi:hypothetical protein